MAVTAHTFGPFDDGAGGNVMEDRWRRFMQFMTGRGASANGVLRGAANQHEVYADSSGMQVKVKTGEVWIKGHWGELTSDITLPIAAAEAQPRKDLVVARAHFVNNRIEYDVITGVAAGSPALPAATQNSTLWETSLGGVDIPASPQTVIAAGQVADGRRYVDNPEVIVHATANLTKNANTTLGNVTGLLAEVSGGARYEIDGFFEYSAHATAAAKIAFTLPTGTTGRLSVFDNDLSTADITATFITAGFGVGTRVAIPVRGWLETPNVAAAGAKLQVQVQFAQSTSHASDAVFYTGSWLKFARSTP